MNAASGAIRILLIEDSCDDAELLILALSAGGLACDIKRVETKPQLDAALAAAAPDIIVCDGHLPGFDGADALRWIRSAWPQVPFVLCLGTIDNSPATRAMLAAADGHIGKDRMDALAPLIRSLLA